MSLRAIFIALLAFCCAFVVYCTFSKPRWQHSAFDPKIATGKALPQHVSEAVDTARQNGNVFSDTLIRRQYANLLSKLSDDQARAFIKLVEDERSILGRRNKGIADHAFKSRKEENTFVRTTDDQDEAQIKTLIGNALFQEFRDDTDLVPIRKFVQIFATTQQSHITPLSESQISTLSDSLLAAYQTINPQLIWFDPTQYQYSTASYYAQVLQRVKIYNAVEQDAQTFLNPDQSLALKTFFQSQTASAIRQRPISKTN